MTSSPTLRVIQISDTHLIEAPGFFLENWGRLVRHVNALAPDLVIHTGDLSFDGAEDEGQLKRANDHLQELDCETLAIPGNHDVGDLPDMPHDLEPPVTVDRCDRFAAHLGQCRFQRDLGAWRLVGINALVLGSGIDCETQEWEHLENALASAGDRHLALFLHKPLYDQGPGDASKAPTMLTQPVRERLHALIQEREVKLVASGHLHEHRIKTIEGIRHVWAPSTGFVTDEILSSPVGTRRVGFVQYLFAPDGVEIEIVCPEDMESHQFLDYPEMYPKYQELAQRTLARRRAEAAR